MTRQAIGMKDDGNEKLQISRREQGWGKLQIVVIGAKAVIMWTQRAKILLTVRQDCGNGVSGLRGRGGYGVSDSFKRRMLGRVDVIAQGGRNLTISLRIPREIHCMAC